MADGGPAAGVYVVPAVVLAAALAYGAYAAADRLGLDIEETSARVRSKQVAAGSTTYYTNMVAGRPIVQSSESPEMFVVVLDVGGTLAGAAVTRELYDILQPGDAVQVAYQRTRVTGQVLVTDVRR